MKRIIIDLRDRKDYLNHHITNSINIPYDKLLYNYNVLLNKEDNYYFYCTNGVQSKKMATFLKAIGYNTHIMS
ncbi:MAG: rhodanese-like domain-containing protein [Bacilli bacterium]